MTHREAAMLGTVAGVGLVLAALWVQRRWRER
jgi:LPXTG-motif cell wall-anchored protein